MTDTLVRDELTVGEGERLEAGTVGGQLRDRGVRDQDALLQVHPLQLVAATRQRLQTINNKINKLILGYDLLQQNYYNCNK